MYLDTGPLSPYCSHHYLLELHLAKPREAEAWVQVTQTVCNCQTVQLWNDTTVKRYNYKSARLKTVKL